MRVHRLERLQRIDQPLPVVFDFFAQAQNLERITPPWLRFELLAPGPVEMAEGTLIDYRLRLHGVPVHWTSRIEEWTAGHSFVDRQLRGPYRLWQHRHTFLADAAGTIVGDEIDYALPLGPLGDVAHRLFVGRDLGRIFAYRQRAVSRLLAA
ncbi:MAG TPA: SRPBCC family protein [Solirubrobacteraceae bacterium]